MSDNAAPETIQVLRVKGWNEHFESAKSRTYKHKSQTYMPNKHGLGYRRIMAKKNGPSIFGAWVSMIQVLSRYHPRDGYLTDTTVSDGRPLTQLDISLMTHVPERVVEEMLTVCSSQVVAWLEIVEVQAPQGHNKDTTVTCQSPYPSPSPSPSPLPSPLPESKRGASAFTLPEWLTSLNGFSDELWEAWMDTRKRKRAAIKGHAVELLLRKLKSRQGDAVSAIETVVECGWTGFEWSWYDERKRKVTPDGSRQSAADQRRAEKASREYPEDIHVKSL